MEDQKLDVEAKEATELDDAALEEVAGGGTTKVAHCSKCGKLVPANKLAAHERNCKGKK